MSARVDTFPAALYPMDARNFLLGLAAILEAAPGLDGAVLTPILAMLRAEPVEESTGCVMKGRGNGGYFTLITGIRDGAHYLRVSVSILSDDGYLTHLGRDGDVLYTDHNGRIWACPDAYPVALHLFTSLAANHNFFCVKSTSGKSA